MAIFKGTLASLFLVVNTLICCVPIYLLAVPRALIPIAGISVPIGAAMTRVIDAWVAGNRYMLKALDITRIRDSTPLSEPLDRDRWYVVISNHQGWSDILILQDTFLARIPPLKFFVKQELIWIPLLGIAMWLLGFPYVRRYSREAIAKDPALRRHDQEATRRACEQFKQRPTTVLNFLEGTRFTPQKHAKQQSTYRNLLTPKTGGLGYVVGALGERVAQILDVTIVYPHGVPSRGARHDDHSRIRSGRQAERARRAELHLGTAAHLAERPSRLVGGGGTDLLHALDRHGDNSLLRLVPA